MISSDALQIQPFLNILSELEKQLLTTGKQLLSEIETLSKPEPDNYTGTKLVGHPTRFGYEVPTEGYAIYTAARNQRETERQNQYSNKKAKLDGLCKQYEFVIILTYLKYFELSATTAADLSNLEKRYKQALPSDYNQKIDIQLLFSIRLPRSYSPSDTIAVDYYLKTLKKMFTEFSISEYEERGYHQNSPYHLIQKSFITPPNVFSSVYFINQSGFIDYTSQPEKEKKYSSYKFENLFSKESITDRICTAVVLDNRSLLKIFFVEYSKYFPTYSLQDLISSRALVGLAAANGCIEVIKFFIEMKINLEQKFKINPSHNVDSKNVLSQHMNSNLEMTPLALAISAAPMQKREQASNMIQTLLNAGANYNSKITKTWQFEHGYYSQRQTSQKTSEISLFTFDQTGILDESVKKIKNQKQQHKKKTHSSPTFYQPSTASDNQRIDELEKTVLLQQKKIDDLERMIKELSESLGVRATSRTEP